MYRHLILVPLLAVSLVISAAQAGAPEASEPPPGGHLERPEGPPADVSREDLPRRPALGPALRGIQSVQVNIDDEGMDILGDAANEPSIAVDPTNPNRLVIGWRQFDTTSSSFRQAGWAYSHDGGASWTFPGVIEPGIFRSDPVLDADSEGVFYYNSLTSDGGDFECKVFRSFDGGVTWDEGAFAWGGDKQWQVIDTTGGPGDGHIYSTWNSFFSICSGNFTRSRDGGESFESCLTVPSTPYWGTMTIGPDGELYISGQGFRVVRSSDAQNPSGPLTWDLNEDVELGGSVRISVGPNPSGLLGQTWIDIDRSGGPNHGNVYLLCSVDPPGPDPMDVRFARSLDGGETWEPSVKVNDDADPFDSNWQWFGTMSVAPNGRIDAVWLDTRDTLDPDSYVSALYYSFSEDGGVTWSENVALSPSFDPHLGWPVQQKMGDYFDMVSDNFGADLAYAATFGGEQNVYYLRIGGRLGDMNCDGAVNGFDIDPFVLALSAPDEYAAQYPGCNRLLADANQDGAVDGFDIDPFVELLTTGE